MRIPFALVLLLWARNVQAGELRVKRISGVLFQIEGRAGNRAWHIQYGDRPWYGQIVVEGPGAIAYFANGMWLRRVNVEQGLVTDRWRIPGSQMKEMSLVDGRLRIVVEEPGSGRALRRTLELDPEHPEIPNWRTGSLAAASSAQAEAQCCMQSPPAELAKQRLAEAENTAARDPLNPWFKIELARIYRTLGIARSDRVLAEALRTPSLDSIELFQVSNQLLADGQADAARDAFERGYGQFWREGNDPRLVMFALARLQYGFGAPNSGLASAEFIERGYKIAPWIEDSAHAWRRYAEILEEKGQLDEAKLWRERSREASEHSLYPGRGNSRLFMVLTALLFSSLLAATLFMAARRFAPWNLTYWSRADRIRLLSITVVGWLTAGALGSFMGGQNRFVFMDYSITLGSFAGPVAISYFESRLPPSPQRDLLLAMAYHHDGQIDKAEALYRKLPAFEESWNNLGALLKTTGKKDEARNAFRQALALNPGMPEAQLNLDRPPSNLWTEMHQKYVGDRPMLAPPSRAHFMRAFGEPSTVQLLRDAFQGPLYLNRFSPRRTGLSPLFAVAIVLLGMLFVASLVIVVLRPGKEIAPPPGLYDSVMNWLLPGVAPVWSYFGGLVLVAWIYALWRVIVAEKQNLYLLLGRNADMGRVFGIPGDENTYFRLQTPELPYLYAGIVLLFLANAVLMWRARGTRRGGTGN